MVIWVYAGGGDSEVGFIKFLSTYFSPKYCEFKRKMPKRILLKPRPNANQSATVSEIMGDGATGSNFRRKLEAEIVNYWDDTAEAIFVLDDSDCLDPVMSREQLETAVKNALQKRNIPTEKMPPIIVGLAVPEIEAWLLADWTNTFQWLYPKEKESHSLGKTLEQHNIRRDDPEAYCDLPPSERDKLSAVLQEGVKLCCDANYSKGTDTPQMLARIDPKVVSKKCPNFRQSWSQLEKLCQC